MKTITKAFVCFVLLFIVVTAYQSYKKEVNLQNAQLKFSQTYSEIVNKWHDAYEQDKRVTEKNKTLNEKAGINFVKQQKENLPEPEDNSALPVFKNGIQAYMYAENILKQAKGLHIEVSGEINTSVGVTQKVKNIRKADSEGKLYSLSTTYSTFMKKGIEVFYDTRQLKTRVTNSVSNSLNANFSNNWKISSLQAYKQTYGVLPNELNYIVNENTVIREEGFSFSNGFYYFELNLNPQTSTENYKKNVKEVGGTNDYPIFRSIKLCVTIDQNGYFKTIRYYETYQVSAMGISTTTKTDLVENFLVINGNVTINTPSGF